MGVDLAEDQSKYEDLPQLWQATSAFINYKSEALNPNSSKISETAKGVVCDTKLGPKGRMALTISSCEVGLEEHYTAYC